MKIVGIMVCGPNEADRYLEASLKEFKRLCDDAVIVGNNTDEKTEKLIKQYGYWFYRDDREWGYHQPDIKTDLLARAGRLHPDWIIAIDADEVFARQFSRLEAEKLANSKEVAFNFLIVNLYNDPGHFAHGPGIQRFWNVRFYKYLPQFGLQFQKTNVHCGLGPPFAYKYAWHAPFYLLHYGLMKKEDRDKKAERYKKYDRRNMKPAYYADLEKDLKMIPFDGEKLLKQLVESVDCQPRENPPHP